MALLNTYMDVIGLALITYNRSKCVDREGTDYKLIQIQYCSTTWLFEASNLNSKYWQNHICMFKYNDNVKAK